MQDFEVGSITFNPCSINDLDDVLRMYKRLFDSERAGWNAFMKVDYELATFKDFVGTKAPHLLKEWEMRNAKGSKRKDSGRDRKTGKKVCRTK